ncbi:pentapeptide repeat-containing protein [uncultured Nocardioides sp.]|uniref:pentapeptide repeat-containing protein n=1 Tax=uncultured Nocardioides sp. TaxID=198441 RepID=UPI00260B61F8|nr:pentapeptide repeat-containing protein [uncultured Nocardioides sp.]
MPSARPSVNAPQIDSIRFGRLEDGDLAHLTENADLEGVRYADLTLRELALPGAAVSATQFTRLNADQVDLKGARFSEVELDQVHIPIVRAPRTVWRDVRVGARVGGLEAYEAQWRSVHFAHCKIDYLNLRGAELVDVAFTDCVIGELDLLSAVVRRVEFKNVRIASLNVQHAKLEDFDLRGANLETIDGLMDLGGATVDYQQLTQLAPLFAQQVGLSVED